MAYHCEKSSRDECIGCGSCETRPVLYDDYDVPIYNGEKYYDFGISIISTKSLDRFVRTAEG